MEYIFAYGTLRDSEVQEIVIGRIIEGEPDILDGFKKESIKIQGQNYSIAVEDSDGFIEGDVIAVSEKELNIIDEYETDAYKRERVVLRSGREAWVYCKP